MKLNKGKWDIVKLVDISNRITKGTTPTSLGKDFVDFGINFIKAESMTECGYFIQEKFAYIDDLTNIMLKRSIIEEHDILFSIAGVIGRVAIATKHILPANTNQALAIIKPKLELVNPLFLKYLLNSNYHRSQTSDSTVKTAQANISLAALGNTNILLPSLEEQKQIADLFQSIGNAIEQIEVQEKSLKFLWKKLIDGFVSDKPTFGVLLKDKEMKEVNYSDVTKKIIRKIDPLTCGVERIVAGENLESEDFKIRTWQIVGEGYLGPAFHVLFKPGDILYGSRRTYLKKVALADFEGVCSNTTYVINADEKLLLQDLLKHIMLSERFTQYSIGVSKGSTNPYINWKDLDNFSFQIPDIETQKEMVIVLDDIINIIEQLKQQKTTLKNLKQKLLSEILG